VNVRAVTTEVVALIAVVLFVYGGTALGAALVGDGTSASLGAAAAVVVLSYGLSRLIQVFDISDDAIRLWGVGLSVALLYLILRVEIAGEPYLWELGWVRDLVSHPGRLLEGRAGDVTEVVLLGAAWMYGVLRGTRALTFEGVLAEVSVGMVVVLLAAAFAPAADAPGALRWLPAPYMFAALLALALVHLGLVDADRRRPFPSVWMAWIGGSLAAIAGLAVLASFFDPPSFRAVGEGIAFVARNVALGVAFLLGPVFLAVAWTAEQFIAWLGTDEPFERDTTDEVLERVGKEQGEPAGWVNVMGYVLRGGVVVLVIAIAVAALWLVFRRLWRRRDEVTEVREEVAPEAANPLGDLRAMLAGALGRLRGRAGPESRDAIGRLYVSMLRRAEARGLSRPQAATPLEFAPRLEEHFGAPVPGAISRSYSSARYGARPPPGEELERLRVQWGEIERGPT
jgi:hypothetical protein